MDTCVRNCKMRPIPCNNRVVRKLVMMRTTSISRRVSPLKVGWDRIDGGEGFGIGSVVF